MRALGFRATLVVCAVLLSAAAPPDPPPPPLSFEASFPEKPIHELAEKTLQFASGKTPTLQIHRYSVEQESGIFVITWFDIPKELFEDASLYATKSADREGTRANTASTFVDETVKGIASSLGGRVDRNARVKRDDEIELQFGGPLLGPDKATRVGVFEGRALLHYDRASGRHVMYTALAATADDPEDHQRAITFVQSFRLKPPATSPAKDVRRSQ